MVPKIAFAPLPIESDEIKDVSVAGSSAGFFIGATSSTAMPQVLHGRIVDGRIAWSAPWAAPLPPSFVNRGVGPDEVHGLALGVDALDPMRLAITWIEYQGGCYGVFVGRWGETCAYLPSPTDSDIRFGDPILLRGAELFTHETSALWHYRGDKGVSLETLDVADELGWHAGIDASGETLVFEAFSKLLFFERAGTGAFRRTRVVKTPSPIDRLAVIHDGRALTVMGSEIYLYGRDGADMKIRSVAAGAGVLAVSAERAVFELGDEIVVVDIATGAEQRFAAHGTVAAFSGQLAVIASSAGVYVV